MGTSSNGAAASTETANFEVPRGVPLASGAKRGASARPAPGILVDDDASSSQHRPISAPALLVSGGNCRVYKNVPPLLDLSVRATGSLHPALPVRALCTSGCCAQLSGSLTLDAMVAGLVARPRGAVLLRLSEGRPLPPHSAQLPRVWRHVHSGEPHPDPTTRILSNHPRFCIKRTGDSASSAPVHASDHTQQSFVMQEHSLERAVFAREGGCAGAHRCLRHLHVLTIYVQIFPASEGIMIR